VLLEILGKGWGWGSRSDAGRQAKYAIFARAHVHSVPSITIWGGV